MGERGIPRVAVTLQVTRERELTDVEEACLLVV
jgi:hypothetical protein